jgi:hypothetical protein
MKIKSKVLIYIIEFVYGYSKENSYAFKQNEREY